MKLEIENRKTSRYKKSTEITFKEISRSIHSKLEPRKLEKKFHFFWKLQLLRCPWTEFCSKSWIPYTNISGFALRSPSLTSASSAMAES